MYRTEEFSLKQIYFSVRNTGKLMLFTVWEGKKGSHVSSTASTKPVGLNCSQWILLPGCPCSGTEVIVFLSEEECG